MHFFSPTEDCSIICEVSKITVIQKVRLFPEEIYQHMCLHIFSQTRKRALCQRQTFVYSTHVQVRKRLLQYSPVWYRTKIENTSEIVRS